MPSVPLIDSSSIFPNSNYPGLLRLHCTANYLHSRTLNLLLFLTLDFGEGFCVFSDIAVAANLALLEYPGENELRDLER